MKKTITALIIIIVVFIITTFLMSYTIINSKNYLKNFNIISVNNINTKFSIKFEKVKAAKFYEVIIYNNDKSVLYKNKFKNNNITINLDNIIYNYKYQISIYAYNEKGDSLVVNNPYYFVYAEPTFSKENSLILNNKEDYRLKIDGDLTKKPYYIALLNDDNHVIKKEKIKDNEYIISKDLFANQKRELKVNLYDKNDKINSISLYSNMSPVKDLNIISPKNNETIDLSDVNLTFNGGENATNYKLQIYKDNLLLKEIKINNKSIIVSSEFFKKGNEYKIIVSALYDTYKEYTKTAEVNFTISSRETLKPTYINLNPNNVKKNSKVELINPNESGKVYYTIDGSIPNEKSILYNDPIEIKENMTIKTIVKDKYKNDSIISEYKFNIGNKDKYKIYISSNDIIEIQDIINRLKANLEKNNFTVYLNKDNEGTNKRLSAAKDYNVDLYLAIYSNLSDNDDSGIETWIKSADNEAYSLAHILHNELIKLYPDSNGNKGIKYSGNILEELGNNDIKKSLIINLGYANSESDEEWLSDNKDLIAKTISDSISKYFGLI